MGKLKVVSGAELVKILSKFGWFEIRRRSSHIIMVKTGEVITLSIPDHTEVAKGTLSSILRNAGINTDEFNKVNS